MAVPYWHPKLTLRERERERERERLDLIAKVGG
jgi:hypothetical protein